MKPLRSYSTDKFSSVLASLPALPSSVRYYDDYEDKFRSIRDLATKDVWFIEFDGQSRRLSFDEYPVEVRDLLKHIVVNMVTSLRPTSVVNYFARYSQRTREALPDILSCMTTLLPYEFRELWISSIEPNCAYGDAPGLLAILLSLCHLHVGNWSDDYLDYVSLFPRPHKDNYAVVRGGECFIPSRVQSILIDYFDTLTAEILSAPSRVARDTLRDACMLLVIYQHVPRPGQVARIRLEDVRVYSTGAVHVSYVLAKKRDANERRRVTRRIKREWCPLFIEYQRRQIADQPKSINPIPISFFGHGAHNISAIIRRTMRRITGESWGAGDLRHTGAQRLADAGASREEIASFMGQSTIAAAEYYIDASPAQAHRINQALGLSPIYQEIVQIAAGKAIDKERLLRLRPDQQIGGIPHGIPISGIGGCATGQSLCSKSPVLSCYGCSKFMPVHDSGIHRRVADDLRPVVIAFADASKGGEESPAYAQLRLTLEAAERVAAAIEAERQ